MDLTPRKRAKIVALSKHAKKSVREIGKELGIPKSTVGRIVKRSNDNDDVTVKRRGRCGRKRKTTARDDQMIIRNSVKNPRKTSVDLKRDLSDAGVNVDSSTIRRRLIERGRLARRPKKKQLLTPIMKKKRLQWAKKHKKWGLQKWRQVIFSDESHFEVQGYRSQYVRRSKGEPLQDGHIEQAPKHPPKKMFWGCFTFKGTGRLIPVEGMMNSIKYKEILTKYLLPTVQVAFPEGGGIFQQDLAPCHTSKMIQKFFKESKLNVLEWPGNSPDLNPIENLWAIIKKRLQKYDCTTKSKLIEGIIQIWYHDEELQNLCSKLVDSMPTRVAMLINAKEGHIIY